MPNLKSFRVFLDERLTEVAVDIFGAFEKMVVEYQEENDRLRRLLRIAPGSKLREIDSLQFSLAVSEEELLPGQEPCEQEWGTILGQDDPEPTQIKEEQDEHGIGQAEHGIGQAEHGIGQAEHGIGQAEHGIGQAEHGIGQAGHVVWKMSNLQLLRLFLNERLTAAAVEIFGAVEKTVIEYQEENNRLRSMLSNRITSDIKLRRSESQPPPPPRSELDVPPNQQELSPHQTEEDPEPTQIKEEQVELWTSEVEDHLQVLNDDDDVVTFKVPLPCLKNQLNWPRLASELVSSKVKDSESQLL
ncbi:hypothetical protein DPEC_G00098140 [Dallia pectoralis]|uniref:Uncharacterized protein n=1 Tax=Dallia pectoralis TaxID=75939 RepID=A0ACC2GVY0_DALPE|nr:hypothetical protein DPEC_G00098140 [Dallia pectoralis]